MKYIALLRGVNVGGKNKVAMAALRGVVEGCEYEGVTTHINSGNVVFETAKADDGKIAEKIHDRLMADLGLDISVMVREQKDIDRVLANNPFDGEFESHKEMHVLFMSEEMPAEKAKQLLEAQTSDERFAVVGREIYCHLRTGVADSLLGKGFIDKKLKVSFTARNWRTVQKLAEL